MSNVECIYPSKQSTHENLWAFNSIVKGMIILEKVGLARYVKKQNASPQLVVLYPSRKSRGKNEFVYVLYIS